MSRGLGDVYKRQELIKLLHQEKLEKLELFMLIVGFINLMNILMRQHGEKRGVPDQFQ